MRTISEHAKALHFAVVKQLGRGRKASDRRYIAQHDVAHAAFRKTRVKGEALCADAPVRRLIPRGERRKHDAVLEGYAANGDRL